MRSLLQNKHTTIAAALYGIAALISGLGQIWLPAYKDQFEATTKLVESFAVTYGLLLAGDAKPMTEKGKDEIPNNKPPIAG
jgi:hypothetical protein